MNTWPVTAHHLVRIHQLSHMHLNCQIAPRSAVILMSCHLWQIQTNDTVNASCIDIILTVCNAGHHRHAHTTSQASAVAAYAQLHALNSVPENQPGSDFSMSSLNPSPAPSQQIEVDSSEPTLADIVHSSTGAQPIADLCVLTLHQVLATSACPA